MGIKFHLCRVECSLLWPSITSCKSHGKGRNPILTRNPRIWCAIQLVVWEKLAVISRHYSNSLPTRRCRPEMVPREQVFTMALRLKLQIFAQGVKWDYFGSVEYLTLICVLLSSSATICNTPRPALKAWTCKRPHCLTI